MAKIKSATEVEALHRLMEEKGLSPEKVSPYIGCSARQIRRWISGEFEPTPLYRKAIVQGIQRIREGKPNENI